jgi:hypothetical protein
LRVGDVTAMGLICPARADPAEAVEQIETKLDVTPPLNPARQGRDPR